MSKPVEFKTDAQLEFIVADCNATIAANPSGDKVPEYYQLAYDAKAELCERERTRMWRKVLRENVVDLLTLRRIHRRWCVNSHYQRDRWQSAAFFIGWREQYKRLRRAIA